MEPVADMAATCESPRRLRSVSDGDSLAQRLRRIPALAGDLPSFDLDELPDDPMSLFVQWLEDAIATGVPEPHAMTVATLAPDGRPSARVVILKDVAGGALYFATDARSRKATDLTHSPLVAVSFYWQPVGRQVRIVGRAAAQTAQQSAADFLGRSPASRAAALATAPGEPLESVDALRAAFDAARARIEAEPDVVLPQWQLIRVDPSEVELWQGRGDRAHVRVQYARTADGTWSHSLVQP